MSTNFPTGLDSFLSIADNPAMNASGRTATQVIGQLQAALAAVQQTLGVTGSDVAGTFEKRLADVLAAYVVSVNGRSGVVLLSDADVPAAVEEWTGTTRTAALSDRGKYIYATAAGAKTYEVTTVVGGEPGEIHLRNSATSGDLTLVASGVSIEPMKGGTLVLEPGDVITLKQVSVNELHIIGTTKAA